MPSVETDALLDGSFVDARALPARSAVASTPIGGAPPLGPPGSALPPWNLPLLMHQAVTVFGVAAQLAVTLSQVTIWLANASWSAVASASACQHWGPVSQIMRECS